MNKDPSPIPSSHFLYSGSAMAVKAGGSFLLFMVLARLLPHGDFGQFAYYYTVGTLVMLIADYGFGIKLTKDIAVDPGRLQELVYRATRLKLVLLLPCVLLSGLLHRAGVIAPGEETVAASLITAMLAFSFITHFALPFRAVGRYGWELVYFSVSEIGSFACAAIAAYVTRDLAIVAISFLASRAAALLFALVVYGRVFGMRSAVSDIRQDAAANFPYFIHFTLGMLYLNLDTILLRYFVSDQDVGLYQAGIRLALAATLPVALSNTVLLPRFARDHAGERKGRPTETRYFLFFLLGGSAIAAILALFGPQIVWLLYGDAFEPLVDLMPAFALVVFLRYLGAVHGTLLSASGRQRLRVAALGATLVFLLGADFYVMPRYGIEGAAWVQVAAHTLLIGCYFAFARIRLSLPSPKAHQP